MKCVLNTVLSVVTFFCLLHYGNLIPTSSNTGEQWIYSFTTKTTVGNNISDESLSQWSLSGRFIIQSYDGYKIMKLEDLKTSAYNGPPSGLLNVQLIDIPKDTEVLTQSFIVYYNKDYEQLESLRFLPNEPQWSTNIKKAFAGLYQVNMKKSTDNFISYQEDENDLITARKSENNILGNCSVLYKYPPSITATKIIKEIDYGNCDIENPIIYARNPITLGYFQGRTERTYEYDAIVTDTSVPVNSITSKNHLKYWIMNSDRTVYKIEQTQDFVLLSKTPITKKPDISQHITKKTPAYTFENNNRNTIQKETLISKWVEEFDILKDYVNSNTSIPINEMKIHIIQKLRNILSSMDLNTLNQFLETKYSENKPMMNIFESLIPYAGTTHSVEFIKQLISNNSIVQLSGLRILVTFPMYVESPSEELLDEMEKLLYLDTSSETVKHTYILSFSNLVHQIYLSKLQKSNNLDETNRYYKNIADKYVDKYYKLITETNDYNIRMKYVLGLKNMGKSATKYLLSILLNSHEDRHLRVLATYAVKSEMVLRKHETYQQFWPIVKNVSEPFDLRAAALSILLDSNINSSELYTILNYINETSFDPLMQHLHNYFYTSAQADKMDCEHCTLKSISKDILSKIQPLEINQGLMTRYHQIRYSDENENFATSLSVHVVANPITNFVNTFYITLNNYNSYHKIGTYSLYVKAEGLSDRLYREEYERRYPVKELYKLLQDIKLKSLNNFSRDLHIEFVVFYEKSAVFALYINKDNMNEMADFIDKIIVYVGNNDIITLRDVRQNQLISDLGTPIVSSLKYEHILHAEFKNVDKLFLDEADKDEDENYMSTKIRSAWVSKHNFVSYNPITNVHHGVSKIFSHQNYLKFKMEYNVYDLSIKWNDENSYFDTLFEFKHATFADHDYDLKTYCSNCQSVIFISEDNKTEKDIRLWLWAKEVHIKTTNGTVSRYNRNPMHEIIRNSKVSYIGVAIAQPLVQIFYIADYLYYIPEYEVSSLSIVTDRLLDDPNDSTLKITFINDALDENFKLNLNFNITLALIQHRLTDHKIQNQYSLNVQRQELSKGVYYGLHYDDGKSIKFGVDSELDFVPALPDTDMFSLKPASPILSKTSIHFEQDKSVYTDIEISSLFSVSKEQIQMVKSGKNYETCQNDYKREHFKDILMTHAPPTKSCYIVSLGMSTYDNYVINLEFKNISDKLRTTLENDVLHPIVDEELQGSILTKNTFNASMVYHAINSTVNMTVDNKHLVSNYAVPQLFRPQVLLKPTSRLIEELRYTTFGLDNICILTPRHVITFYGKVVEFESDTSIVPLIECTNNTRVGVINNRFTYKLWSDENTFQLGKKAGGYYVMRNGKYLKKNLTAEDYVVDFINDHTFHITTSRVEMYYNGEYLTLKIRSAFMNRMCGTCVSGEFSASNLVNKYFQ